MKGILTDNEIVKLITNGNLTKADSQQIKVLDGRKVISYGVSSYGYDVRLSDNEVKLFANTIDTNIIDPKDFDTSSLVSLKQHDKGNGKYVILPSGGYALGSTVEHFNMPPDVTCIVLGKSTYARSGIVVNVTPIEAGFRGTVVIELSNPSPLPVKIYLNEGIAQFLFFRGANRCDVSYADRNGKYQDQTGIQQSLV